tara:strand:+ start:4335 stop:6044 length:1710 start_codon:yes stop_codon:yes gene_type:complete
MPQFGAWLAATIVTVSESIATFLTFGATSGTLFQTVAWAVQTVITGGAMFFVGQAMMPKMALDMNSRGTTFRAPTATRKIIYGEAKVGGAILFLSEAKSPVDREHLYVILGLAGHECEEINTVYFQDEELSISTTPATAGFVTSPARYYPNGQSRATINRTMRGQVGQTLSTNFSTNTELNVGDDFDGICCLQLILAYDQNVWTSGIPSITAIVKGKKLYDPRTSNTVYSDNPALALRDYLTNTEYGMSVPLANIDDDNIIAAANVCDEQVALDTAPVTYQKRYTCNGTLDTGNSYASNIATIIGSMAGYMVYQDGRFKAFAGEWVAPTSTIGLDDLIGPISVVTKASKREAFNTVIGTYIGADSNYQPQSFPQVQNAAALSSDGEELKNELMLPLSDNAILCQRLAKIHLLRSRQELTVNLSLGLNKFAIACGDNVSLTLPSLGLKNAPFEVIEWNFGVTQGEGGPILGINVQLKQTDSSVFDWVATDGEEPAAVPDIVLTHNNTVTPPTFSLSVIQNTGEDGTVQDEIQVDITDPALDPFIYEYDIAVKETTEVNFDTTSILRDPLI